MADTGAELAEELSHHLQGHLLPEPSSDSYVHHLGGRGRNSWTTIPHSHQGAALMGTGITTGVSMSLLKGGHYHVSSCPEELSTLSCSTATTSARMQE